MRPRAMRARGWRAWFRRFHRGDPVVYRKQKASTRPGPRAQDVEPALRGETYAYVVEKQWRVADANEDGLVALVTRRGKVHVTDADDRNLRRPSLWERWRWRHRFPALSEAELSAAARARDETSAHHDELPHDPHA